MSLLNSSGSLMSWTVDGVNLLFPKQELIIKGVEKIRGDSHVCYPIFGTQPETKDYEGVDLPQHGFVRGSSCTEYNIVPGGDNFLFRFDSQSMFPWRHSVSVSASKVYSDTQIVHTLMGIRDHNCVNSSKLMPLSMGFHPYFATRGEEFLIVVSGVRYHSDDIREDEPFLVKKNRSPLRLVFKSYTITIDLGDENSSYTHFCIWTDSKERYICIEPIMRGLNGKKYVLLMPGEGCIGQCSMEFSRKH